MKKDKKAKKDADKLRKKIEKKQEKLQKKEKKKLKKLHKKDLKEEKKIRKQVKKEFGGVVKPYNQFSPLNHDDGSRKKVIDTITKSVILNKTMMERDGEQLKKWQESYYNEMFTEFKEIIRKHNEAMNFKLQDLTDKISSKRKELEGIIEQIKKRKEELAIPQEK